MKTQGCRRKSCQDTGKCWMMERVLLIRRSADAANAQDPGNREYNERGAGVLRKGVIDTAKEYGCPNIPRN